MTIKRVMEPKKEIVITYMDDLLGEQEERFPLCGAYTGEVDAFEFVQNKFNERIFIDKDLKSKRTTVFGYKAPTDYEGRSVTP